MNWVSNSKQEPKLISKNLHKSLSELLAHPSAILDGQVFHLECNLLNHEKIRCAVIGSTLSLVGTYNNNQVAPGTYIIDTILPV